MAERLIALHRQAPYDHFAFWGRLPGFTHEQALHAIRLFASEVIPRVRTALDDHPQTAKPGYSPPAGPPRVAPQPAGLTSHARRNRAAWNARVDAYQTHSGPQLAASGGMAWGVWQIPDRLLRPGGLFAFSHGSPILEMCWPIDAQRAGDRLVDDYFGMHWIESDDEVAFQLPYGEWVRLFRIHGFEVLDLIEPRPAPDAVSSYRDDQERAWSRRWPAECIWRLRRT